MTNPPVAPPPALPPEQNIGPFFKLVGVLLILGMFAVKALEIIKNHTADKYDIAEYVTIVLALMIVWRPKVFDNLMRSIATALPDKITKYAAGPKEEQ